MGLSRLQNDPPRLPPADSRPCHMRAGQRGTQASTLLAILVAALGYFVDVFDIWLYSSVRKASLEGIGYTGDEVRIVGERLLNWQMGGFILGAILFGIMADKKGRLAVLFGSILTYSLANIANGFVTDYTGYAACRLIAGIGLAGELGAGIALVSELVSATKRGWATTFVATVGVCGSVAAPLVAKQVDWRVAYYIGGAMGLVLLVMRIGVFESGMFEQVKAKQDVKRGDFGLLFQKPERVLRYLASILCGAPVWFFAGLMMIFNQEIQTALKLQAPANALDVIAIAAFGLCVGDVLFGALSQFMKSRKKAFLLAYAWMAATVVAIFTLARDGHTFFWLMFVAGVGAGFWAVFVTTAGEVFGTNLRGTVATTAPSFVRGLVIPMTMAKNALVPALGSIGAIGAIGAAVLALAVASVAQLPETFGREMDYVEE